MSEPTPVTQMEQDRPEKKHDSIHCPDCQSIGHVVGYGGDAERVYECRICHRSWWRPPREEYR